MQWNFPKLGARKAPRENQPEEMEMATKEGLKMQNFRKGHRGSDMLRPGVEIRGAECLKKLGILSLIADQGLLVLILAPSSQTWCQTTRTTSPLGGLDNAGEEIEAQGDRDWT